MITRIYTWFYTLKIASATNATQPLASKKKTKKQNNITLSLYLKFY